MLVNIRLHAAGARGRILINNVLVNVRMLANRDSDLCIDCLHVGQNCNLGYFKIIFYLVLLYCVFIAICCFIAFTIVHYFDVCFIAICW